MIALKNAICMFYIKKFVLRKIVVIIDYTINIRIKMRIISEIYHILIYF